MTHKDMSMSIDEPKAAVQSETLAPKPLADVQAVRQQLQELRAALPTLAQNDALSQQRSLAIDHNRQLYNYDYTQVKGVAMLKDVPFAELPSFEWLTNVGDIVLQVVWNQELVAAEFEGREWLGVFDRSLKDNVDMVVHKARTVLNTLFQDILGEDHALTIRTQQSKPDHHLYLTLKQRFQSWSPEQLQSKESIVDAISALIPQLMGQPYGPARSLNDYASLFKGFALPPIADQFQADRLFGYYRVAGPNPTSIRLAPANWNSLVPLSQTQAYAIKGYEDLDLTKAFNEQRLYLLDQDYLNMLQPSNFPVGQKYLSEAKSLYYRDDFGQLMPLAIRCTATDEHVFTPNDGYGWQMAKTMVQVADSNYHELVAHLGQTHLVLEAFVIASHRQLSTAHPVFKLLAPHFEGTAFINWAAKEYLVAKGNFVDKLLAGTIESSQAVVAKAVADFQFNKAMPDQVFQSRGVTAEQLLYPYRDDAILLWTAINSWVGQYLDLFYTSDGILQADAELQAWAGEITSITGGRIADFGETATGELQTKAYLTRALSMIIFTASAQHAAVNFTQSTLMSYLPSMPLSSYAPAPTPGEHTRKDWLGQCAPLEMAMQQVSILHILGSVHYTSLGQYGHNYFKDDRVAPLVEQFQLQLDQIKLQIAQRNSALVQLGLLPYEYLSPQNVPQSINI